MRKLILLCLFVIGLGAAIFGFLNYQGLAAKGDFETIVLDFREDIPAVEVEKNLQAIALQYNVTPKLDNKFSEKDHVYVIKGDRQRLKALRKSSFAKVQNSSSQTTSTKFLIPVKLLGWQNFYYPKTMTIPKLLIVPLLPTMNITANSGTYTTLTLKVRGSKPKVAASRLQ